MLTPESRHQRQDRGFTLVELIISIGLLGVIVSVLSLVMFSAMATNSETRDRLNETRDEQLVAAYFAGDVSGARAVAAGAASGCGAGTAVVELRGESFTNATPPGSSVTIAGYVFTTTTVNGVLTGTLTRRLCEGPGTLTSPPAFATPNSTVTVARRLAASPPVVTCSPAPCSGATTEVSLRMERLGGGDPIVLTATRRTTP